uniref:CBM21 domain-containing protein n=1 Tax=Syphacia muris TaxID=451379 RepID=A0A0N5A810_9BILA
MSISSNSCGRRLEEKDGRRLKIQKGGGGGGGGGGLGLVKAEIKCIMGLRCRSAQTSPIRDKSKRKSVRFKDSVDLEQVECKFSHNRNDNLYQPQAQVPSLFSPAEAFNEIFELRLEKQFELPPIEELEGIVSSQFVRLENIRWFGTAITGLIRVANLCYDKVVEMRHSYDDWTTWQDLKCTYSG